MATVCNDFLTYTLRYAYSVKLRKVWVAHVGVWNRSEHQSYIHIDRVKTAARILGTLRTCVFNTEECVVYECTGRWLDMRCGQLGWKETLVGSMTSSASGCLSREKLFVGKQKRMWNVLKFQRLCELQLEIVALWYFYRTAYALIYFFIATYNWDNTYHS